MLNYWTEKEMQLLKDFYSIKTKQEIMNLLPTRSWSSILSKANTLKLNKRFMWTPQEDALLCRIYDKIPMNEVLQVFDNRTRDGIIHRAQILGLNSYDHPIWTDCQKQYIKDNWELLPDFIMAEHLHKTKNAVKRMRNLLGLHRQDKSQRTYDNISKYVRGNIWEWKVESMKSCNYMCVFTKSKQFEIHHKYPVNKIISTIFMRENIAYKNFADYSQDELKFIVDEFIEEQRKYPLGVCVRKDIHQLFHHLYGQYDVDENKWNQFVKDYNNGIYDNYKINVNA